MAELALRNHVIEGAEVIGTFTDDGVIISEERASGLPLSGPISLSAIGSYLGQGNKMWMSNGYLKDLAQSPSTKKSLSEYYGAAWGQPHQTVNQGAGMQIVNCRPMWTMRGCARFCCNLWMLRHRRGG